MKKMKLLSSAVLAANLLLCAVFCQAQGKWQVAKKGTKPYYANVNDRWAVCDSVSYQNPNEKLYALFIRYFFTDTTNHPVFSCGHKGSYHFKRKIYQKGEKHDPNWDIEPYGFNYCDICNKKIMIYYYPKDSLIADYENY